jgi:hypothetical protein
MQRSQGDSENNGCPQSETDRWYGANWASKTSNSFRLGALNVGGFSHDARKNHKLLSLIDKINENRCDIMCISDHGLNLSKVSRENQLSERLGGHWEKVRYRFSWNRHDTSGSKNVVGGTGIIVNGRLATKIQETGIDPSGLGRWTWIRLRERNNVSLRILAIYCPVSDHGGP